MLIMDDPLVITYFTKRGPGRVMGQCAGVRLTPLAYHLGRHLAANWLGKGLSIVIS
jgi:hypothetical protein